MTAHGHGWIKVRWPLLVSVLCLLHLPWIWLVRSGESPCGPECTNEWAVTRDGHG